MSIEWQDGKKATKLMDMDNFIYEALQREPEIWKMIEAREAHVDKEYDAGGKIISYTIIKDKKNKNDKDEILLFVDREGIAKWKAELMKKSNRII